MTNYPTSQDNSFTLPAVSGDTEEDISINALRDAVFAIEAELGNNPSAIYSNVGNRLNIVESRLNSNSITELKGNTITIKDASNNEYLQFNLQNADGYLQMLNNLSSFAFNWEQAIAGIGVDTVIEGQQGAPGNVGGPVIIRSGKGGTPGTDLGGGIVMDLAEQVDSSSDYFDFSTNGVPFLKIGSLATYANIEAPGAGVVFSGPTWQTICSTNIAMRAPSGVFDFNTINLRDGSGTSRVAQSLTTSNTITYAATTISTTDIITKRSGNGANVGASRTFAAQDGQDVAGGTNNNGGSINLRVGIVGSGGTGGNNGRINVTNGVATLLAISVENAYLENYGSTVTSVTRSINSVPRHYIDTNGNRFSGNVRYAQSISPTSIGTNQTDYNPTDWSTATRVRQAVGTSCTINSAAVGEDGERKLIQNLSTTNTLTLLHDNGSTGTAAQRFLCPNATSVVIPPLGSAAIEYDNTASRWRVVAFI